MNYLLNGLPYFPGTNIFGTGLFADGTNAAPSISFQSDPDTGLYLDASNTLGIATAGAGTVLFSSSAGIGKIKAHGTRVLALEAGTGNTNITLTPSGTGTVVSTNVNFDVTSSLVTAEVYCTAAFSIGRGGSIALGGLVDGSNSSTFAAIAGQKESGVSGATGGYLGLFTRASGAAMGERARILSTGRFLLGTTTDSGALLQIGTDTIANTGGIVFGTSQFLYRSSASALAFSTASPVFQIVPSTGTQNGFFTVVNSGGTTYIGCDNSTGSNFGCGAYAAIFGSGSESTGIVAGGAKALTIAKTTLAATFVGSVTSSGKILSANTGLFSTDATLSNYSATNGVYLNGNAGGWLRLKGDGIGASNIQINGGSTGNITVDAGSVTRLTINGTTGAATFAGAVTLGGALKLANAYVAGAVVGTGYVTIQDSTGTTYRVPVLV